MKAVITSTEFITEGGCNACQPFSMATYDLTFEDGKQTSLENLDVAALIMALAQKNQWKQELDLEDMDFDEAMLYKKDGQMVKTVESPRKVTFTSGGEKVVCDRQICDLTELFAKVNEVAAQFFGIEATEFEVKPLAK